MSVIENCVYKSEFEKLRRNLRKGILKGIYWILSRFRVGILYEFCVVLLRDFFDYTVRPLGVDRWKALCALLFVRPKHFLKLVVHRLDSQAQSYSVVRPFARAALY